MEDIIDPEELNEYFEFICKLANVDLKEILAKNNFSGSLGLYFNSKDLFRIYTLITRKEYERAWSQCSDYLRWFLKEMQVQAITAVKLRQQAEYLITAAMWLQRDEIIASQDRQQWLRFLSTLPLLREDEKNEESLKNSSRNDLTLIETIFEKKLIKIYKYIGEDALDLNAIHDMVINDTFVMGSDLNAMLNTFAPTKDSKVRFTLMLKIEEIFQFSYFVVGIQYRDSVWLASDQPVFANPGSRLQISQRGGDHYLRENSENTIFPYRWLEEIIKYRQDTRSVTKKSSSVEYYKARITTDFTTTEKILLNLFFNALAKQITVDEDLREAKSFLNYLEEMPLSLTDGKEEIQLHSEAMDCLLGRENLRANGDLYCKDLITDQNTPLPEIVGFTKNEIIARIPAFTDYLLTEEEFRKDIAWSIRNSQKVERQIALNQLKGNWRGDLVKTAQLIVNNFPVIAPWLFAGKKVYIHFIDFPLPKAPVNENTVFQLNVPCDYAYAASLNQDDYCLNCKSHKANKKNKFGISFYHYSQLQFFTGKDRLHLPSYLINYRTDDFIPYVGNSLLDNVNPLHQLRDPASGSFPNKLYFPFYLCGYCKREFEKYIQYDNALILFSLQKAQPVKLVDYAVWREEQKKQGGNPMCHFS